MKQIIFGVILLLSATIAVAQRQCASHDNFQQMILENPEMAKTIENIERHTQDFITKPQQGKDRAVITIPIVFHIVWRTGKTVENISDAQIQSQLDVMNKDFRKLNSDVSKTPALFAGLAADCEVQFCMAQRDPNGAAATGIVRYQSSRTTDWGTADAVKKPASGGYAPWDATKYLNIWVCSIGGGILGYAQFPGGSTATDGVVIDYRYFGTTGTATAPYHLGRTATHEVGHWLNLRHIWGDATCGSDLVTDTPTHTTSNGGCPAYPKTNTCNATTNTEMTMNYMDYTDDACMYMFSAGQKARMQALFVTGGARASLVTSNGCTPGSTVTCGTPTTLASSAITSTGATVSWAAVSGASSYNVQYKTSTGTTWTTVSSTTTSIALTGLVASTAYNYQVAAVCSGVTGSYSAASTFTTSTASTCGIPSGLAAASITTSGATVSWTAVSGAVSYNLQYKKSTATTWTTSTNNTTTSKVLTGLSSGTIYNYKVAAVCSGLTSAYSTASSFTTNSPCTDAYENNNTQSKAKTLTPGTYKALISSSTDQDWFKVVTTATAKNIRATISNLPADFDIALYNSAGTLLNSSLNTGLTNDVVKYNNATGAATYYVKVYSVAGAYNASSCYTLLIETSSTALREIGENEVDNAADIDFTLFPNPASEEVILNFVTENSFRTDVTIQDITGRIVSTKEAYITNNSNRFLLDVSGLENGMYIISARNNSMQKSAKLMIER